MHAFVRATPDVQRSTIAHSGSARAPDTRLVRAINRPWSRPSPTHVIQTKLALGTLLDPYEHEADREDTEAGIRRRRGDYRL